MHFVLRIIYQVLSNVARIINKSLDQFMYVLCVIEGVKIRILNSTLVECFFFLLFCVCAQNEAEKPNKPRRIVGWWGMVTLNSLVILVIFVLGTGFGSYASVLNIVDQVKSFGIFQKCYQCSP